MTIKLSKINHVVALGNARRNIALVLAAIEQGQDVEITVGGWPLEIGDGPELTALLDESAKLARHRLAEADAELAALGVEVDVTAETIVRAYHGGWDEDDEPEQEAA